MKLLLAAVFACLAVVTISEAALAQGSKKGAGMTCAQRCSAYCNSGGKHHNCFDRCTTIRCAGK